MQARNFISFELFLGPEIDHHNIRHHRPEHLAKSFVSGMNEIFISRLVRLESEDKTMSKTFVVMFRANICSPFKRGDTWNFGFQFPEGFFDPVDLIGGGGLLEFQGNDMVELSGFFGILRGCIRCYCAQAQSHHQNSQQVNNLHSPCTFGNRRTGPFGWQVMRRSENARGHRIQSCKIRLQLTLKFTRTSMHKINISALIGTGISRFLRLEYFMAKDLLIPG